MLDPTDLTICRILQQDARTSNAEIARRVGMAPSATLERLRKLEERGVVEAYTARLAPGKLGLGLLAFVFVRAEELPGEKATGDALAAVPEALEVHHVAGEDCYLVKLRARDTEHLGRLLRERLGAIATVRSTRTTVVLETVRESTHLPVEAVEEAG